MITSNNKLEIFENFVSIPKKQSSQNSFIVSGSSSFNIDNMSIAMQRDASTGDF